MTRPRLTGLIATFVASILVLGGCAADPDAGEQAATDAVQFGGTHVPMDTFVAATEMPGVIILDVRTPAEFAEGHLPGAVNIDVSAPDFTQRITDLDPTESYAVYCRTANRSQVALDVMADQGFSTVVGMDGGIGAWPGPVVRP